MNGEHSDMLFANHRDDLTVECPDCHATRKHCRRPSGHAATQWHVSREDAYAVRCGCAGCAAWLAAREAAGER